MKATFDFFVLTCLTSVSISIIISLLIFEIKSYRNQKIVPLSKKDSKKKISDVEKGDWWKRGEEPPF